MTGGLFNLPAPQTCPIPKDCICHQKVTCPKPQPPDIKLSKSVDSGLSHAQNSLARTQENMVTTSNELVELYNTHTKKNKVWQYLKSKHKIVQCHK